METPAWTQIVESFDDMMLKESLLRGIYGHGFERPSPIQSKAIVPIIEGKDVIAQAQSGTGKTGTFVIASLQVLKEDTQKTQVLILAPTRELAKQTCDVANDLGTYLDLKVHLSVGGTPTRVDMAALRGGAQLVVATPGRAIDMMQRGALKSEGLQLFVLDEADELLSRGFKGK